MSFVPPAAKRPTVLVGANGSETVVDALALAHAIATPLDARVEVAFVHPAAMTAEAAYGTLLKDVADTTRAQLDAAGLPFEHGGRLRLLGGWSASRGLQALAVTLGAALLVVGSTTRAARGRIHPGSTGRRLLSGGISPVAIAPRGYAAAPTALEPVGVAYDGSPEAERALDWAAAFARAADAECCALTVDTVPDSDRVPVGAGLASTSANGILRGERQDALVGIPESVDADAVLLDGDPATELIRQSEELGLLVAGSRSHGQFNSLLLGSVSKRLVHEAGCPVVIVPRAAT